MNSVKIGDKVKILSVLRSYPATHPAPLGRVIEVFNVLLNPNNILGPPWVVVELDGVRGVLRGDQYEVVLPPATPYASGPGILAVGHGFQFSPGLHNPYVEERTIPTFPSSSSGHPQCECGSDAVKAPQHSAWCPKHAPSASSSQD